jgi:hypothetical protein
MSDNTYTENEKSISRLITGLNNIKETKNERLKDLNANITSSKQMIVNAWAEELLYKRMLSIYSGDIEYKQKYLTATRKYYELQHGIIKNQTDKDIKAVGVIKEEIEEIDKLIEESNKCKNS